MIFGIHKQGYALLPDVVVATDALSLRFGPLSAGSNSEARIAMMAITTSSSISVKAFLDGFTRRAAIVPFNPSVVPVSFITLSPLRSAPYGLLDFHSEITLCA